jgi:lactoylglutathione lyase
MAKPIHSMIRVLDEARSVDFYRRALALEIAERIVFDSFTLIYMRGDSSPFELELTINHGRTESYQLGDGYGHLAVVVDDLAAEHARMERDGLSPGPMRELQRDGAPFARFFFMQDPDGYRIEVLQQRGRYR